MIVDKESIKVHLEVSDVDGTRKVMATYDDCYLTSRDMLRAIQNISEEIRKNREDKKRRHELWRDGW